MKSVLSLVLLLGLMSCARKSAPQSDSAIGKTKEDVIQDLQNQGGFQGTQVSKIDSSFEELIGVGGESFFIKDGRIISKIRNARKEERPLIFWREKFKGKLYRERVLKDQRAVHGHQKAWLELACDSLGTGVIFDPVHERVVKVFYYAIRE